MAVTPPLNLTKWIDDNRHLLKPPVGNAAVYHNTGDFIVMVVGGPNTRKDFHYNETEELFLQLEGDVVVRIFDEGEVKDIEIREGDMFLLPAKIPHSPQRGPNTVGLVIEKIRKANEKDSFLWLCESCNNKLYEEELDVKDIVRDLPPLMARFYADEDKRTCKKCGTVMEPPQPRK
ncbi:MAG TPA: 3-hydroxyanthranilate 3,4-dioxygenase [Chitinophagaceae bacterium]|nr:3-hydroxyanthranilate 3,4-dioxygenase [Chitinophagaceae bacterium]